MIVLPVDMDGRPALLVWANPETRTDERITTP